MTQHNQQTDMRSKIIINTDDLILVSSRNNIFYIELGSGKQLIVHGVNGSFIVNNLQAINKNTLQRTGFIRVHTRYFINPDHVARIRLDDQKIDFNNGVVIPINKIYKRHIEQYFTGV